jgi:uncharacterized membrane protein
MDELTKRLDGLEQRLARIEQLLGVSEDPVDLSGMELDEEPMFIFEPLDEASTPAQPLRGRLRAASRQQIVPASPSVTTLLGWAGAAALVMAAVYLVKLGVDAGWLTPLRREALAVLGGLALIGTGFALRQKDRQYASLLPAGGVVILFLAVYSAHLYYGMIPVVTALAGVILICLASLWFCRVFASELYALFAVVGSYTAPWLLGTMRHSVFELAIYYSAWGLVFSLYAIWIGRRRIYLLALYLALVGFDLIWRSTGGEQWTLAFTFQTVQLLIFATATVLFSIRREEPLDNQAALAHGPALLIFYMLQYALLDAHLPAWAPWIAVGSASFVALLYLLAKARLSQDLPGGRLLLSAYIGLVLFHAGYLEMVPDGWKPWVALLAVGGALGYGVARRDLQAVGWPIMVVVGVVFVVNYLQVVLRLDSRGVVAPDLLVAVYAAQLYAGYWLARRERLSEGFYLPLVYAGHIALMSAAVQWFDSRLAVSFSWGLLAVACLGLALQRRDKVLGQSSLLVFAVSGMKVLVYDLAGAAPLVRIACLVVVGVTFYLGGWLYRKVALLESEEL